ncbi:MAG: HPr family phosphocarrier protein [Gammaproteobacteria bacterium]
MKELCVRVCNPRGLHARPSAQFSSVAKKYDCRVTVTSSDRSADGKSIMGLLTLAATHDSQLTICLVGPEANEAADALLDQCHESICLTKNRP